MSLDRAFRSRLLHAATFVLLAGSLHGCSDSSTGPEDVQPATLSEVLLEASNPLVSEIGSRASSFGPLASIFETRFTPAGCNYVAASQSFLCPSVSSNGLAIERSFILFDAAGNRQSQFSPTTTASVQTKVRLSGTAVAEGMRLVLENTDDRTVSGLLTGRHVLNGTSTMSMSGSVAPPGAPAEPMTMTTATRIENLVLPSRSNEWPGPGTMTMDSRVSIGGEPEMTFRLTVQFSGTKCATMTISGEGELETFSIDLSNPNAAGCRP